MRNLLRMMFHRVAVVRLFIIVQVVVLLAVIIKFYDYFVYFYGVSIALNILVVLWIISNKSNPSYKMAWIISVLMFPFFGGLFYLMFGGNRLSRRTKRKIQEMEKKMDAALVQVRPAVGKLAALDEMAANQSSYIAGCGHCPVYSNTITEYMPMGEIKYEHILEELKKAKHFIFLEYFIIAEGKMWSSILHILADKVKQGVEVRVIYDDLGCIMTLPGDYKKKLEAMGIKCSVFNPLVPVLSSRLNNRDHRKICVIDGHTGFTGGINLADEYINAFVKYGHWKDTAIMLKGDAVWSLTVMFLTMWDFIRGTEENYDEYRPKVQMSKAIESEGYVQPFADNPLDFESVGETVYMNLINKAKRYVYINTPYLIIDNEMVTALCSAAKSGVEVRIVTPHIADKWFVHMVTQAYYETLLTAGVKIYEYTPGFMHAKTFVVDDEYAVVGSINLDYRSLYLNFESAVWLFKSKTVLQIKEDYTKTLEVCQQITLQDCRQLPWYRRLGRTVLRVFSPLM